MSEEICPALIRKNIVLAETGGELTLPLARLNANCEFKKKWDEIQRKWHGKPLEQREYQREYHQKPEVKERNNARRRELYKLKKQLNK